MKTKDHHYEMQSQICDALLRLLDDKPYARVEIKDICDAAFVSRQTFYRYFKNKDNIVRWKSKEIFRNGICRIGRDFGWHAGFRITLEGLYRMRGLYADPQNPAFTSQLMEFCSQLEREALMNTLACVKGVALDEKLLFQIDALDAAQAAMTRRWSLAGMEISPAVMADYMTAIVPYDLYHLMNDSE